MTNALELLNRHIQEGLIKLPDGVIIYNIQYYKILKVGINIPINAAYYDLCQSTLRYISLTCRIYGIDESPHIYTYPPFEDVVIN